MKKWYQKLSHPWAKSAAGFTLVELIVVIAIMGVLGGVGTLGYSGYIKNANKNADKTTIGNILRAVDTGANTGLFVPPEGFKIGDIDYPVGFVVLSDQADESGFYCRTMASTTDIKEGETTNCSARLASIAFNVLREERALGGIQYVNATSEYAAQHGYTVTDGKIVLEYCEAHTPNLASSLPVPTEFITNNKLIGRDDKATYTAYVLGSNPEKGLSVTKLKNLAVGHTAGGTNTTNATFDGAYGTGVTNGALHQAIEAAFGPNYRTDLMLKYNGWNTGEDTHTFGSMYTYAPTMIGNVKDLSQELADFCNMMDDPNTRLVLGDRADSLQQKVISGDYNSSDELFAAYSKEFMRLYGTESGKNTFLNKWDAVGENDKAGGASSNYWSGEGFGFSQREFYCATRKAYNSSVASYFTARGKADYANIAENFNRDVTDNEAVSVIGAIFDMPTQMPALFCFSAIDNSASGIRDSLTKLVVPSGTPTAEQTKQIDDMQAEMRALYKEYVDSGMDRKNGEIFYKTVSTVQETNRDATESGEDFFDYYTNYLSEMQNVYQDAMDAAGNGVVIMVSMVDGKPVCEVSPSAANPRNDG